MPWLLSPRDDNRKLFRLACKDSFPWSSGDDNSVWSFRFLVFTVFTLMIMLTKKNVQILALLLLLILLSILYWFIIDVCRFYDVSDPRWKRERGVCCPSCCCVWIERVTQKNNSCDEWSDPIEGTVMLLLIIVFLLINLFHFVDRIICMYSLLFVWSSCCWWKGSKQLRWTTMCGVHDFIQPIREEAALCGDNYCVLRSELEMRWDV